MGAFTEAFSLLFGYIGQFWWLVLPFFAWGIFWELWTQFASLSWDVATSSVLYEIRLPREYKKQSAPSMEHVISSLYHIHKDVLKFEHYVQGMAQRGYSLEIGSNEGEVHFYLRVPSDRTRYAVAEVYAQFPDAEVVEVEDYTKTHVPIDAMTTLFKKEWDLWGTEFFLVKDDVFPLRTYIDFALDRELSKEETKVDPLANIVEALASVGPDEYFWYQILIKPEIGWEEKSQKAIDKIAGKEAKEEPSVAQKAAESLTSVFSSMLGAEEEEKKEEQTRISFPIGPQYDEMKAIDGKRSKLGYRCTVRCIYLARKEKYNKRHAQGMLGFFRPFVKYNSLKTDKRTVTTIDFFFKKLREHDRKKNILLKYRLRAQRRPGFILNTEELATLFHLPGKEVASMSLQRVPAKKAVAPAQLPVIK